MERLITGPIMTLGRGDPAEAERLGALHRITGEAEALLVDIGRLRDRLNSPAAA